MRIYFAASLFTQGERVWNRMLAKALAETMPGLTVVLPQDFKPSVKGGESRLHGALYRLCVKGIDSADAVVAIFDGDEVDSGTAWEAGYACARGKPVVGVRTDFRPGADRGVNFMLSMSCRFFIHDVPPDEDVDALAREIVRRLKKLK